MKVLVLDTSVTIREKIVRLLSEYIPDVKILGESFNLEKLQNLVNIIEPDAVVLDCDLSGAETFSIIKNLKMNYPSTYFINISNYNAPLYRKKCFNSGIDYYFDKPSDINRIINLLIKKNKESELVC